MRNRRILQRVCGAALLLGSAAYAAAGDWPNWRGPNHDGRSADTGLKPDWIKPLPLVWERKIGSGFSSFAIADGRVYTGGTADGQQALYCLDANTGAVVWQKSFEKQFRDPQGGDGPRSTPAVSAGRVYMFGAHGRLLCADAATGSEVWARRFDSAPQWGYSGSPLIEGELCVISAGGGDGALVALDKATGQTVWKTGDEPVGYATPYPLSFEGTRYIVGFLGTSAIIVEAATGRQVWRMQWQTDWNVNAASPIFHDGYLYLSSGYNHGSIVLRLRREGDRLAADKVWESRVLRNKFESAVLHEGHLYSGDETGLQCVELATGAEKWDVRRIDDFNLVHSTVAFADGHLYVLSQSGELLIAPATPEKFAPLTNAKILGGRCWTVSVIHHGRIYARDLERMVCFGLKE